MARPRTKKTSQLDPELARFEPRERVLICARDLFQQKGFEGLNIRDLMEVAAVNQSTIYYYFQNKDGLFLQTLLDLLEELDQEFRLALRQSSLPMKLKALVRTFTRPPTPNLLLFFHDLDERVAISQEQPGQGITAQAAKPAYQYVNQSWPRSLEASLKESLTAGEMAKQDLTFLTYYLLNLLTSYPHSPFGRSISGNPKYSPDDLLEFLLSWLQKPGFTAQI